MQAGFQRGRGTRDQIANIHWIMEKAREFQKNHLLPIMEEPQETWVRSLGREGPLEEGMATHCSILAGKIPWIGEPGGLQSVGSQRVRHN